MVPWPARRVSGSVSDAVSKLVNMKEGRTERWKGGLVNTVMIVLGSSETH